METITHNGTVIHDKIVDLSFGQTSGYMLRRLMDQHGAEFDRKFTVIFENTGKEHDATLEFGHEIETRWGVEVIWLEYCRTNNDHDWRRVNYETAARRFDSRTPFDELLEWAATLPNSQRRICTGYLKVRTQKRFLKSLGMKSWQSHIGIRADEAHRALEIRAAAPSYIKTAFPLIDLGVTVKMVNDWWDAQPFKLQIPNHMGNCDLCFLKAKWKRLSIMEKDPSAAKWWIDWERKFASKPNMTTGDRWINGQSYASHLAESQHPQFDFSEDDLPCSCVVGGYREADED